MTPQAGMKPTGRSVPEPARHTIRIVVEDGKIKYAGSKGEDATRIIVRRGDTIVWQSDHGNYAESREGPSCELHHPHFLLRGVRQKLAP